MKKLITIILALIMMLFNTPNQGADQAHVTAEKTPQTAITIQVEQVPEESGTTPETAFVSATILSKKRFHDLRHSCASVLLAQGVPMKQIQEWLGHSDMSTTANIYSHLDAVSKADTGAAMSKALG